MMMNGDAKAFTLTRDVRVFSDGRGLRPGTYNLISSPKPIYSPVIVECFFKGAAKCSLCERLLYGDYYKDGKKIKPLRWCLDCYRFAFPAFTTAYLDSIRKTRHCSFVHKHIRVENIVHHLIPRRNIRRLSLIEKAMWTRYGKIYE